MSTFTATETDLKLAIEKRDIDFINIYFRNHSQHGRTERALHSEGLYQASKLGDYDIAKMLVDNLSDIDINYEDSEGISCLSVAIQSGNISLIRLLIKLGANVNAVDNTSRRTTVPLHFAAESKQVDVLQLLLNSDAEINEVDKSERTALITAIKQKNVKNVRTLIDSGADVNLTGQGGMSPVCEAVMSQCVETVNLLLKAGGDPNVQLRQGRPPLHLALGFQNPDDSMNIILELLNAGAKVNTIDTYGYTPLHECIILSRDALFSMEYLKLLTQSGAELRSVSRNRSIKNYDEESSLYLLLCHDEFDAVKYLVYAGWNLHAEPLMDFILCSIQEHDSELHTYIEGKIESPCSLIELTRKSLRNHLLNCTTGKSITSLSRKLPIPTQLLDYVCLRDI